MDIRQSHRVVLALAFAAGVGLMMSMPARSQGMGRGMMGGGMMGGSGPRNKAPSQSGAANPDWDKLSSFVQANRLSCMSCHAFSGRGAGPAFMDIAHRFAGQVDATTELSGAISNGVGGQWPDYPPMPGGLATPGEAKKLAELILHLARPSPSRHEQPPRAGGNGK